MFLKNLDSLMAKKGINKNILAKESGVPYTTIDGFYKKGWDNVKLSTLIKIAEYFDISLDSLVFGEACAAGKSSEAKESSKGESYTPKELELLGAYRKDAEKRALMEKVLKGELVKSSEAKAEEAPAPVRRKRKDDIVIF